MAHDSHIIIAKENLMLRYSGLSQRRAADTNRPMEALCQGRN